MIAVGANVHAQDEVEAPQLQSAQLPGAAFCLRQRPDTSTIRCTTLRPNIAIAATTAARKHCLSSSSLLCICLASCHQCSGSTSPRSTHARLVHTCRHGRCRMSVSWVLHVEHGWLHGRLLLCLGWCRLAGNLCCASHCPWYTHSGIQGPYRQQVLIPAGSDSNYVFDVSGSKIHTIRSYVRCHAWRPATVPSCKAHKPIAGC